MSDKKRDKLDKAKDHKSRIHTTERPFTLHIDEDPDTLASILMTAPPKKADEWRYLKGRE